MINRKEIKQDTFSKAKCIAIFGRTGSGKTALSFSILQSINDGRKIYWINYPKPELIKPFGYEVLLNIERMEAINNCIIVWDEPQLALGVSDYKRDEIMAKVLSLARQRNILLILLTSDTRLFSPKVESYIDYWCVKDCEYAMTKQRGKIRQVIKKNSFIIPEGFRAEDNEFLLDCPEEKLNGKYIFSLISQWSDELSRPYNLSVSLVKQVIEKPETELVKNS